MEFKDFFHLFPDDWRAIIKFQRKNKWKQPFLIESNITRIKMAHILNCHIHEKIKQPSEIFCALYESSKNIKCLEARFLTKRL